MADTTSKPVIFLAFANDRDDTVGYLRNLPDEMRGLRHVLEPAEQAGLCDVVVRSNSTADDIFKVFQDPRYRNRIAMFHYGGHANGYQLLLESAAGHARAADAGGLAAFLAQQQGLQLVFLNGCSTLQQTQGLLDANVSAVISTSRAIDDRTARDFSCQFYQGLGGGAGLQKAFDEAAAVVETSQGNETRGLYLGDATRLSDTFDADRLPWLLSYREGMEHIGTWNLPNAVDDPLFGLPPPPEQDLPESPYRHLNRFTREDADVYFGRGHQIRELYDRLTAPRTAPIMLFYGQSGVGKSSILDAGLIPRLEHDYEVRYLRRTEGGLLDTLQLAFLPEATGVPIETAWYVKERQLGKPLIVFLDQLEELYTRPIADVPDELDQLLEVVNATFVKSDQRPRGKLVLGFRKEWLAELESQLVAHELPRSKVFLEPLDRRGVIEVVQGPARTERLHERYGLTVEEGLAELIADDLLADRDSAIAPTLQILLTKMWAKATEANYEHPEFSQSLYQQLRRDGILLRDFLNQQIAAFRERYPEAVDSGLLLDIVALHTTSLGTADQRTVEQLQEQYAHLGVLLPEALQLCQDLHLLTVAAGARKESVKTTRLAHDTLAPLVREQYEESDKPGQRARRILDNRSVDWAGDRDGTPLDAADLAMVEQGASGTRALTPTECRLLEASRRERHKRLRFQRTLQIVGSAAVVLITVLAITAGVAGYRARKSELAARTSLRVARDAVDEMLAKVASESLKDVPQMEQIRATLLKKAKELYGQLSAQQGDTDALRWEQARSHFSLGEIHSFTDEGTDARREYQLAIDLYTKLVDRHPGVPQYRADSAKTYNKYGYLLSKSTVRAERFEAETMYANALAQFELMDEESQQQIESQTQKALTLNNRGVLRGDLAKSAEAMRDFDAVIAMLSPYKSEQPSSAEMKECLLYLAYGYNNRAWNVDPTASQEEAISNFNAAIAIIDLLRDSFPKDREIQLELAKWCNNLAGVHSYAGEFEQADECHAKAVKLIDGLATAAPNVRNERANSYLTRVTILVGRDARKNRAEADLLMKKAKSILDELIKADKTNADYLRGMQLWDDYNDMLAPPAGADR